jgi:hypothetical protein
VLLITDRNRRRRASVRERKKEVFLCASEIDQQKNESQLNLFVCYNMRVQFPIVVCGCHRSDATDKKEKRNLLTPYQEGTSRVN